MYYQPHSHSDDAPKVILIEDNHDNIATARDFIQLDGSLRVLGAWPSGRSFFLWFDKSSSVELNPHYREIDLVLLDIEIVGEDGFSFLQKLRERPEFATTKIVAWTAQHDLRAKCQRMGFDGFITKPINGLEFVNDLHKILAGEDIWE